MGLLDLFSNREVDEFARSLAKDLAKRYPPALDATPEKKISQNRIAKVLEDTVAKAVKFNTEKKLGVYKKARLGNTFKWELKELGYSEKFIEVATEGLIVYLSRNPAAPGGKPSK